MQAKLGHRTVQEGKSINPPANMSNPYYALNSRTHLTGNTIFVYTLSKSKQILNNNNSITMTQILYPEFQTLH
jgi:hypothetical protein